MRQASDNMLASMMSGLFGLTMQLGASLFAFMIVGLGIPLFSIWARMNLTGSGLVSYSVGNALGVYLPFGVAWMLYQGRAVTTLLSWGGVVFTSMVAFILPLLLALHTVKEFDTEGVISIYFGHFSSKRAKVNALRVLLGLAVVSVTAALIGNVKITAEESNER